MPKTDIQEKVSETQKKMVPVSGACVMQSGTQFFCYQFRHVLFCYQFWYQQQTLTGHCYYAYFCLSFGCK